VVNLNNPMTIKGPYRELLPALAQTVKIQVPPSTRAVGTQLLVSGQPLAAEAVDGFIVVAVPSILDHEVIAIDLAPVS
jgi:hypothetical protein